MERRRNWNASVIGLTVVILALVIMALVQREWWLLAVAAGCSAVLFAQFGDEDGGGRSRSRASTLVPLLAAVALVPGLACGDDDGEDGAGASVVAPIDAETPDPVPTAPAVGDDGSAVVAVSIEDVEGIFVEGFEVGLRFETGDGDEIESILWSEVVEAQDPSTPDAPYDTVLEQPVPTGEVVVLGEVNVGAGPPPSVPDLDGELPCRAELELGDGERGEVEVRFDQPEDCLHRLDG